MSKPNVIIIHGAYGHPVENWFDWMRVELEKLGVECLVPQMPTPDGQELERWIELFNSTCSKKIKKNTILIGHSLGAAFLLKWLEQANQLVSTTILVGAFTGNVGIKKFDKINESFFANPFEWNFIKNKSNKFICYHGSNDPYVSRANFESIADNLQAIKIIISNGGHLNEAAGYTSFPQLLIQLKTLIGV